MRGINNLLPLLLLLGAVGAAAAAAAAEEVDEFDDVVVDMHQTQAQAQAQPSFPAASASEAEPKQGRRMRFEDVAKQFGVLEYGGLAVLVLYVLNYLVGRSSNGSVAKRCSDALQELLKQQFSHVAPALPAEELDPSKPSSSIFFSDATHKHSAYCTGRRHCEGMIVDLDLQKRQDLISLLIGMFYPEKDLLVLQAVMDDSMEPVVMAIAPSKSCRNLRNANQDLKDFAGAVSIPGLEEPLSALGEDAAVVTKLISPEMIQVLNDNARLIDSIHVTDQNILPVAGWKDIPKKVVRFSFRLQSTSSRAVDELQPLVEMALGFIDALGSTQMNAFSKSKAVERRKKIETLKFKQSHQQRQEAQQQKKVERIQREKELYEHMSEDAKAKYDAKEARRKKKEEKKKQTRVKMIKA